MLMHPSTRAAGIAISLGMSVFAAPTPAADEELVRVSVLAEHPDITPGGTVWIGVRMDIQEGWHTYWPGKNDSGAISVIEPKGPEGVGFGPIEWPAPTRHLMPGDILDHVYYNSVVALVPVTAPRDAQVGSTLELTFDVSWLVCESVCIPGECTVTLSLPVAQELSAADPAASKVIAKTRARIPQPLPQGERIATAHWNGHEVTIRARGAYKLAFYPDTRSSTISNIQHKGIAESDFLVLKTVGEPQVLSGVLEIFSSDGHSRLFLLRSSPGSPNS